MLRSKKNVILQGAPGLGKTFVTKRLAYSTIGVKDPERIMMVQFHQSFSYETSNSKTKEQVSLAALLIIYETTTGRSPTLCRMRFYPRYGSYQNSRYLSGRTNRSPAAVCRKMYSPHLRSAPRHYRDRCYNLR